MSYKKTIKTPEEIRLINEMSARRTNELIMAVNRNTPAEEVKPPLSEAEAKYYEDLQNELAELREKNPRAGFWPVEYDSEDIDTSCYGKDFLDQF